MTTSTLTPGELFEHAYHLEITLDGKPATLAGSKGEFMVVAALDGSATFQWSLKAIHSVLMNNSGAFKS